MKITATTPFPDPGMAYRNLQNGLRQALSVSKEELERRVVVDNAARPADREQRGYLKRGPKKRRG